MRYTENSEKISITLPQMVLSAIEKSVNSGEYASSSKLIEEALYLWQERSEEKKSRIESIRRFLEQSAHSGEAVTLDEAFNSLKKRHESRTSGDETIQG